MRLHTAYMRETRNDILELFSMDRTWTMAQVHAQLRHFDLSTIYRNVQKLAADGLIVPIHTHGQETVYELAKRPHHDHLVCQRCHGEECVPCPAPALKKHVLELFGVCQSCRT